VNRKPSHRKNWILNWLIKVIASHDFKLLTDKLVNLLFRLIAVLYDWQALPAALA